VYSLLEDDKGWIWVGTAAGLFRYDGVAFVPYSSALARQSDVHNLKRGIDGRVYAQNFRGQLFSVQGDSLQLVGDFQGLNAQFLSYGFLDRKLLISTGKAILQFEIDQHTLPLDPEAPSQTTPSLSNPHIHSIGCQGALIRRSGQQEDLILGQIDALAKKSTTLQLLSTLDQADSTWVVRGEPKPNTTQIPVQKPKKNDSVLVEIRLIRASGNRGDSAFLHLPSAYTKRGKLYAQGLPDGRIILAGVRGILLLEKLPNGQTTYTSILNGRAVNSILVDRESNLWVGTETQGLVLIPDMGVRQEDFTGVHAPIVDLAATADEQYLFAATFDGSIYQLRPSLARLSSEAANSKFWQSHTGRLFVANVEVHPQRANNFQEGLRQIVANVKDGEELSGRRVLLASNARAEIKNQFSYSTLTPINGDKAAILNQSLEIRKRRATGIAFDPAKQLLFIAYNDSLLTYKITNQEEASLQKQATVFDQGEIGGLAQTLAFKNDILFIGLASKGLSTINLNSSKVNYYLGDQSIERIRTTPNFLYVQTSVGVFRSNLNEHPLKFEQLSTGFGLPAGKPTAFYTDEKYTYAAYDRRVVRIPSEQKKIGTKRQSIAFAKTELAGVPLANPNKQPFNIEANRESLRFEPRIPNFSQAPATSFEYRILGTDTSWQVTSGTSASIFLNALPAGTHTLEIQLAGAVSTRTAFSIRSRVPFWRKPWPYILATGVLALLAISIIRRRAKRKQLAAERETALRDSQLTALAAQMNPHFIFNALNSVQDFMMRNERLAANDYLTKFAKLIRLTLDHSRVAEITLDQELDMMRTYLDLERIRFDDEIEVELLQGNALSLSAKLPALLVQPYVENAFKHGLLHRKGLRRLLVQYNMESNDTLCVTVEDNGVGRSYAEEVNERNRSGNRFASGATERRIALLNADNPGRFSVEVIDLKAEGSAIGTRVILHILLNKAQ